ncbi:alpha/beta hydrolase family protein [Undibacterium sp. TJN19]|uniref:alpha/beta hydrolase family protein n=1 Tax=Undibacterium sp. TJN19 TaxID=3413055 RepID=UPI003BF15A17
MKPDLFASLCLLLASSFVSTFSTAVELPVEAFAALPAVQNVTLSPDGSKIAMLVNKEGNASILVHKLGQPVSAAKALLATDNRKFTFQWFRWVNNEKLLVSTLFPNRRIVNGYTGGVDVQETRLLAVNADGSQVLNLIKPTSIKSNFVPQFQDRVIDFFPDDGKHVLIMLADQERSNDPTVYSLDLENGSRRSVQSSRENFRHWMVDRQHQVRLGLYQDKLDIEVHLCDPDGKNWRKRWAYKIDSKERVTPIGFGKEPNQLYVLADHQGRRALFTVDLREENAKPKLVLANPNVDIAGELVYSEKTGEAIGLAGTSIAGKAEINYWDQDRRELVKFIDDALPKRFNSIVTMSRDENRYIVHSSNAQQPGIFYLGDDKANTLEEFSQNYPALPAKAMLERKNIKIKANDGVMLPAFLSLPQTEATKNLPVVLLVNIDRQGHDEANFDIWTQFLVNRGYAVVELHTRNSVGSDSKLVSTGNERSGQVMPNDLADVTKWLLEKNIADPARICIVGASYGAYAALMGAVKSPDMYQCIVSLGGVSDLNEMGQDNAMYINGKALFENQVGTNDREKLKANSPRFFAKDIKSAILLVHGTQDRAVRMEQSIMMDAALNEAGRPHQFLKLDDGDHNLSLYVNRLQFLRELENFLAKNLKP